MHIIALIGPYLVRQSSWTKVASVQNYQWLLHFPAAFQVRLRAVAAEAAAPVAAVAGPSPGKVQARGAPGLAEARSRASAAWRMDQT